MTPDEIATLPVGELAAADSHLHLWVPNAFLFKVRSVMEAWGFTYKSVFVWVKPSPAHGNYWRNAHELLLLGVRGSCPFLDQLYMSWRGWNGLRGGVWRGGRVGGIRLRGRDYVES